MLARSRGKRQQSHVYCVGYIAAPIEILIVAEPPQNSVQHRIHEHPLTTDPPHGCD